MARTYRKTERAWRRGCAGWALGVLLVSGLAVAGWWRWGRGWSPFAGSGGGASGPDAGEGAEPAGSSRQESGPQEAGIASSRVSDGSSASRDGGASPEAGRSSKRPEGGLPSVVRRVAVPLCPPGGGRPRLWRLSRLGNDSEWLLVGCGREVHLLALGAAWEGALRVVSFHLEPEAPGVSVSMAAAAAGDVTGDGRVDLLLGFVFRADGGGISGGALHLVPGAVQGGFSEPLRLLSAPVAWLQVVQVDGRGAEDLLAGLPGERVSGRPAEVRSWLGGAALRPHGRVRLDAAVASWAASDVDGDGTLDVLAVAPGRLFVVRMPASGDPSVRLDAALSGLEAVAGVEGGRWMALVDGRVVSPRAERPWLVGDEEGGRWGLPSSPWAEGGWEPGARVEALWNASGALAARAGHRVWWERWRAGNAQARWEPFRLAEGPGEVADVAGAGSRRGPWSLWRGSPSEGWGLYEEPMESGRSARPVGWSEAPLRLRLRLP